MISSKTVYLLLAMLLLAGSAAAQIVTGGGGGVAGSLSDNTIYLNGTCNGATNCFALPPGNAFFDCTYVNGSPTVTCTASDNLAPFSTGTWRIILACCGASGGTAHIGSALENPAVTTILSVNNGAHTITMNQNATVTRASVLGQAITIVQDLTSQFQAAATAALGSGGHCLPWSLGAGMYGTRQGFANTAVCKDEVTNSATTGWGVNGAGPGGRAGSTIVPLPDFDFSTCTGQNNSCFFGVQGAVVSNLSIWGGENSTNANSSTCGTNSKNILDGNTDTLFTNILIAGWCANDTTLRAIKFENPGLYCFYCIVDGAGALNAEVAANAHVYLSHSFFGDSNGGVAQCAGVTGDVAVLCIGAGAKVQSVESGYGVAGANKFLIGNAGTLFSENDIWVNFSASNNSFMTLANSSETHMSNLVQSNYPPGNTADAVFFLNGNTSTVLYLRDNNIQAGSANFSVNCSSSSTGTAFDKGGNIFNSNTTASNCPRGNYLAWPTVAGANPTLTANVGATNFTTPNGSAFANATVQLYELHYDMFIATAGTAGTITVNLICANGSGTSTQPGAGTLLVTAAAGTEASGVISCHSTSTPQWSVTGITTPGTLSAPLNMRIEVK